MVSSNITIIILGLAAAWFAQVLLSGWQTRRFFERTRLLRKDGLLSIGAAGGMYRGRLFVVLVINQNDQIVHAEQMSGWTIFAQLKPVSELKGLFLSELMDESKSIPVRDKTLKAFRNAGSEILKAREKMVETSEEANRSAQDVMDESPAHLALSEK